MDGFIYTLSLFADINVTRVFLHIKMKIYGIDFTSRPSKAKPLTCAVCSLEPDFLNIEEINEWHSFKSFEDFLSSPGPWIAGLDFPFGQSRKFVNNMGWPKSWKEYIGKVAEFGRDEFKNMINAYKEFRPYGDKEHRRLTDIAAGSISPQKIYGIPVGLMFFEGAPRLLKAGTTIPGMFDGDPNRIVVESYPGVLVRNLIGRRKYKHDDMRKQTIEQAEAREAIKEKISHKSLLKDFGCRVELKNIDTLNDHTGDRLDAILCALQAAWAWSMRDKAFGMPNSLDTLEGWIADPKTCRVMDKRKPTLVKG